jgi:pantetheine-phosphate adenylyltransferase
MRKALYPGSFDPVTFGHLDVIERASKIADEIEVVIMHNPNKNAAFFTLEERIKMLEVCTKKFKNVHVSSAKGLTVDYAKKIGATALIRGIRAVMDYEYELQQATANQILAPEIETIFLLTSPKYSFLSSSVVKSIAVNNGDLSRFVPEEVERMIKKKYQAR